jgi:hypothetical protein
MAGRKYGAHPLTFSRNPSHLWVSAMMPHKNTQHAPVESTASSTYGIIFYRQSALYSTHAETKVILQRDAQEAATQTEAGTSIGSTTPTTTTTTVAIRNGTHIGRSLPTL